MAYAPHPGGPPASQPGQDVERWYDEYHTRLLSFLRRSLRTESDAQDVSQEVYLRLLRIPEDRVVEHPRAYLFRVAANVVNDWRSDQKLFDARDPEDFDKLGNGCDLEEDIDRRNRMARVERALAALPPLYRATILLKSGYGLSYREIAERLDVSERMVKRYIVKGYARLREKLAAGDGAEVA